MGERCFSLLLRKQAVVEVPGIIWRVPALSTTFLFLSIPPFCPSLIIEIVSSFTSRVPLSSFWFFLPHP